MVLLNSGKLRRSKIFKENTLKLAKWGKISHLPSFAALESIANRFLVIFYRRNGTFKQRKVTALKDPFFRPFLPTVQCEITT